MGAFSEPPGREPDSFPARTSLSGSAARLLAAPSYRPLHRDQERTIPTLPDISPLLVWGVFTRLLGVVYCIAFTSLFFDVLMTAGSRGLTPAHRTLARARRDFGPVRAFLYFPSILLVSCSDTALRGTLAFGAACALVVVWGGPFAGLALVACWVILLSHDASVDLSYPWECVLLEAGFLALLLPPLEALPSVAMSAAPLPAVAWAYRFLLFRVVFGFGKFKFLSGSRFDWSYLRGFLIVQPIPSVFGWLGAKLPLAVLKAGLVLMFLVEIPLPFAVFANGWPRLVAAAGIGGLMVAIQLSGNFGYFNVLMAVLCVTLLDHQASLFDLSAAQVAAAPLKHVVLAVVAFGGLLHLPFVTWFARSWIYWPSLQGRLPAPVRWVLAFYRFLLPFRMVQAYGVFPPEGAPAARWVPVVEGTRDGVTWHPYVLRSIPTDAFSPPRFVAPHCPRLDHWFLYEGSGGSPATLHASLFALNNPYRFTRRPPIQRFAQRLLEGSPDLIGHCAVNPFPDPANPPLRVRVRTRLLIPTSLEERARTGAWWHVHDIGTHLPETGLVDGFWDEWLSEPELFHWDARIWKRRARALDRLRSPAAIDNPHAAIVDERVTAADVESFWNTFVPALQTEARRDWTHLPELWRTCAARFDRRQLLAWELVAARLATVLGSRVEPFFLGTKTPRIDVATWFHVGLLVHAALLDGREAYDALVQLPERAAARAPALTNEAGLLLLAVFRPELMRWHAAKARVLETTGGRDPTTKGLPGFAYMGTWMAAQLPSPEDALLPHWKRGADLEWELVKPLGPPLPLPERGRVVPEVDGAT